MMRSLVPLLLVLSAAAPSAPAADPAPTPARQPEAAPPADNPELARLFSEDQSDRMPPDNKPIDWAVVGPRDLARQARVKDLYAANQLVTGADFFHAAMVLQHGQAPEDFLLCHELCFAAVINGSRAARWLAAASEDRFLMNLGRPQRFGTQFRALGNEPMTLYKTDDGVTDALRKQFGVPTLAESKAREALMNARPRMLPPAPSPSPPEANPAGGQPAHQP